MEKQNGIKAKICKFFYGISCWMERNYDQYHQVISICLSTVISLSLFSFLPHFEMRICILKNYVEGLFGYAAAFISFITLWFILYALIDNSLSEKNFIALIFVTPFFIGIMLLLGLEKTLLISLLFVFIIALLFILFSIFPAVKRENGMLIAEDEEK